MWTPLRRTPTPIPEEPCGSESSTEETTVQRQIRCEFQRIIRRVTLIGIALLATLAIGGTIADYRSCKRSEPQRRALRHAAAYWRAHGRPGYARTLDVPRLACFTFPPGE